MNRESAIQALRTLDFPRKRNTAAVRVPSALLMLSKKHACLSDCLACLVGRGRGPSFSVEAITSLIRGRGVALRTLLTAYRSAARTPNYLLENRPTND